MPPSLLFSTKAAFAPSNAAFRAQAIPPEPPPITSRSNAARDAVIFTRLRHLAKSPPQSTIMAMGKILVGVGVLLLTHAALSAVQRTYVGITLSHCNDVFSVFLCMRYVLLVVGSNLDRSFLKLTEDEYTGLPTDVSVHCYVVGTYLKYSYGRYQWSVCSVEY